MKINWFKYKTMTLQKMASILGVKVHVFEDFSKEKTIDESCSDGPNDWNQATSVPEKQIGDV